MKMRVEFSPLSKRKWVKDAATNFCNVCCGEIQRGSWFSFSSNKHHCRYCGHIVCSLCSTNKLNALRICDCCHRLTLDISDAAWTSEEDELSPANTPLLNSLKYQEFTASGSTGSLLESEIIPFHDDISFNLDVDIDHDHSSALWGAITECPEAPYDEYHELDPFSQHTTTYESSLPQGSSDRFERGDVAKRDLVYGFVRECWRTMLQFNGFAFPGDALMALLIEWLTVNDVIDEYHTNLGIIHQHEALCHLKSYRSVDLIERTKEWNRECYHSFGSDIWSRGAQNVWKVKVSGHDDNAQKTCILIGIVEADKVRQFTDHRERRDVGSFSDEEHGGYALLTGNWRTYHEDSDQGQLFSASMDPIALSPDDVMAVEIDLTPKYGAESSSKCGTLKYALNGSSTVFRNGGVAFDDIDIDKSYRLAIGMYLRDKLAMYQVV